MRERKKLIQNILAWLLPLMFGSLGERMASWDATAPILPLPAAAAAAAAAARVVMTVNLQTTMAVTRVVREVPCVHDIDIKVFFRIKIIKRF